MSDPTNETISDAAQAKITIFISYVHEDFGIAGALNNMLQNAFGSEVAVFLDKVAIQHGDNILTSINANLEKADILAVVSTDAKGPRHWAGYEIGYFQASHRGQLPPGHPLWGKIVTFCSAGGAPEPLVGLKHVSLGFDNSVLEDSQDKFAAELRIGDEEPLLQWFGELLMAVTGEKLKELKTTQELYKANICRFWKAVFAEFKQRPKFEFKPQKQLKVRFNSVEDHSQLGEDAEIDLLGNAHLVFGIASDAASRTLSWKEFCAELASGEGSLSTFATVGLARILSRAAKKTDSLDEVSGNLIWSHNEQRLFRVILTTYTTYYNGKIQASLYLVEVSKRKDIGSQATTLLGKGLQAALRFRSLFIEENGLFNELNITIPQQGLSEVASDILAELDFLNMDLLEADLGKPAAYNGVLTPEEIKSMAATWQPLKETLIQDCKRVLAARDITEMDAAKSQLAASLRKVRDRVGPVNETFLKAVAAKLIQIADEAETHRAP